ncbi:hypothetical protein F8388_019818 [Cannabis sativa]|uniref:Endonuclease/exonuclease/phosphatase domain-containing protein n=1 Tax=Cannabis sativa TaxID=3483 RepID=A0A7J6HLY5_CANSA|nr:hypothetical protein F8388_019818 [Cannabis sativa]
MVLTMQRSGSVEHTEGTKNASKAKVGDSSVDPISNVPEIWNIPPKNILTQYPLPDFAHPNGPPADVDFEQIPDIGPSLIQGLDIPHIWSCRSQQPHNFPEPINLRWPSNDPELQKIYQQLLRPEKCKVHTWYHPTPDPFLDSPFIDSNGETHGSISLSGGKIQPLESPKFNAGSVEPGETSKGKAEEGRHGEFYPPTKNQGPNYLCAKFWKWRGGGRKHAPTCAMRCLAWNCRGLRRPAAERTLRGFSRRENVDVVFLSETKVDSTSMTEKLARYGYTNVKCIDSTGTAGGFCVGWKAGLNIQVIEVFLSGFSLLVDDEPGLPPWMLFCIYGTPYHRHKRSFWRWLTSAVQNCKMLWALFGDLNNFLMDCDGIDLGFIGQTFTWNNARDASNRVRKRLDRVVANSDWCVRFAHAGVVHFSILHSDHAPLILDSRRNEQKRRSNPAIGNEFYELFEHKAHDRMCALCNTTLESEVHLFWECSFARALWFQSPWSFHTAALQFDNFEQLFTWFGSFDDHNLLFHSACVMEEIWLSRNDMTFHNSSPDPNASHHRIMRRFSEFYHVKECETISDTQFSEECLSNFDAIFMTDASVVDQWAGLAFVQIGNAAESFHGQDYCQVISVLHAELEAILLALKAASVKKFSKIQILSDNATAIRALKVRELPFAWGSFPVFRQCVEMFKEDID